MKKTIASLLFFIFCTGLFSQSSWNVSLLYNWKDSSIIPSAAYNNTYNEVWGFEHKGKEYAVIGTTAGTHFFDVTDAANSVQVAFVQGAAKGGAIIHRDFKNYQNYLYSVCDEGASTLQIIDFSYLPDSVKLVYNSDSLFKTSHNVFVDTAKAKLYACGTRDKFGNANHLEIFSLANPEKPSRILKYNSNAYFHDIYVRNDTAFGNNDNKGFFVYNFADSANPQIIGSLTNYIHKGYNHSGWLTEQQTVYALCDETHGMKVKLLDVTDFSDIKVIDTLGSNIDANSIVHNAMITGNYLFLSYYYDGLYIFDISNPNDAKLTGYYDTSPIPNGTSYQGAWGVYSSLPSGKVLLSDMQEGLFVFDASLATGIENQENISSEAEIRIFPNPAKSWFYLVAEGMSFPAEYTITDFSGKVIKNGIINRHTTKIDFSSSFTSGTYIVSLLNNNNVVFSQKVLKINEY